jgi:ATP-dependent Clp protease ATP-binding subunit ClpB
MKGKRNLNLAAFMAGSGVRGQFEERLKGCVRDMEKAEGNVILFIPTSYMQCDKAEGRVDIWETKPALARGNLQLVGATTLDEYRIIERVRHWRGIFNQSMWHNAT